MALRAPPSAICRTSTPSPPFSHQYIDFRRRSRGPCTCRRPASQSRPRPRLISTPVPQENSRARAVAACLCQCNTLSPLSPRPASLGHFLVIPGSVPLLIWRSLLKTSSYVSFNCPFISSFLLVAQFHPLASQNFHLAAVLALQREARVAHPRSDSHHDVLMSASDDIVARRAMSRPLCRCRKLHEKVRGLFPPPEIRARHPDSQWAGNVRAFLLHLAVRLTDAVSYRAQLSANAQKSFLLQRYLTLIRGPSRIALCRSCCSIPIWPRP
jgi:hypothetical protein